MEGHIEVAKASVRSSFQLLFGDVFSTAVLAIGSIIVARMLGPSDYGAYSLSLVIPSLLGALASLGVDQALLRFTAKWRAEGREEAVARIIRSGLLLKLIAGAVLSASCFFLSDLLAALLLNRPELGFYAKLASVLILLQAVLGAAYSLFIGLDRALVSSLVNCLMSIVKSSTSPLLVILGLGVLGAVLGHVAAYAVASVLAVFLLLKYLRELKDRGSRGDGGFRGDLKLMIGYGLPIYASALVGMALSQYRLILLGHYATNLEVGNFNVAANLTTAFTILLSPILVSLFSGFSKLSSMREEGGLERLLRFSVKYVSYIIVPASVSLALLSDRVVRVVYGPEFMLAPSFLSLYALLFLLVGFGYQVLGSFFSGVGEARLIFRIGLLEAAFFAPVSMILTALYGVFGLILAILASGLASTLYGLWLAHTRFKASLSLLDQFKIYLASGLSALPLLLFLKLSQLGDLLSLALGLVIFAFTYFTLAPIIRAVQAGDVKNLELAFSGLWFIEPILRPALKYEALLIKRLGARGGF